ncbi:MAG: hypothetical protein ACP5HG_14560 [Anaerolineae bacterium]
MKISDGKAVHIDYTLRAQFPQPDQVQVGAQPGASDLHVLHDPGAERHRLERRRQGVLGEQAGPRAQVVHADEACRGLVEGVESDDVR